MGLILSIVLLIVVVILLYSAAIVSLGACIINLMLCTIPIFNRVCRKISQNLCRLQWWFKDLETLYYRVHTILWVWSNDVLITWILEHLVFLALNYNNMWCQIWLPNVTQLFINIIWTPIQFIDNLMGMANNI